MRVKNLSLKETRQKEFRPIYEKTEIIQPAPYVAILKRSTHLTDRLNVLFNVKCLDPNNSKLIYLNNPKA